MAIPDSDLPLLKQWILKRVSTIADSDSEILAEYVIALLQHDDSIDQLRSICLTDLRDFLHAQTEPFVNELLEAFQSKSFLNPESEPVDQQQLQQQQQQQQNVAFFGGAGHNIPLGGNGGGFGNDQGNFFNANNNNNNNGNNEGNGFENDIYVNSQRNFRNGFRNNRNNNNFNNNGFNNNNNNNSNFNNNGFNNNNNNGFRNNRFNNNGNRNFRNNNNNGNNWNNNNNNNNFNGDGQNDGSMGGGFNNNNNNGFNNNGRNNKFNNNNNDGFNNNNNHRRQNYLHSIASTQGDDEFVKRKLVIEKIPDEKFNEADVREYFARFGDITEISLDHGNHLALVEYATHNEARQAWSSPDPIFDNRFVKVYWRKNDESQETNDQEKIDVEAVKQVQAQKQKEFEEKLAKKRANQEKLLELTKQKLKLLELQKEQAEKLLEIAEKKGDQAEIDTKKSTSDALRTQLDALKREAARLGIPTGAPLPPGSAYPVVNQARGGSFRGRGRGGFYNTYNNHYNPYGRPTRGAFNPSTSRFNLDLRPRTILVKPVLADKEESFRGYIVSIGECEEVARVDDTTLSVTFKDRRTAESFYYASSHVNEVGELEKQWKNTPSKPADTTFSDTLNATGAPGVSDTNMEIS